jgi:hypothetical protein
VTAILKEMSMQLDQHMSSLEACRRKSALLGGAWVLGLLVAFSGCGDSESGPSVTTYPVKGKVILPDGKPLSQGLVTFVPAKDEGRQASGKLESDGTFALTTRKEGDGAAPGEYVVRIDSDLTSGVVQKKGLKRSLLPEKYSDEHSSGLKATVKAETNDLPPFQLDDKPASSAAQQKVIRD